MVSRLVVMALMDSELVDRGPRLVALSIKVLKAHRGDDELEGAEFLKYFEDPSAPKFSQFIDILPMKKSELICKFILPTRTSQIFLRC